MYSTSSECSVDETRATVDDLRAKLDEARFNLEQTVVTAPDDGYVTQHALRPGMMALSFTPNPVMTYISKEEGIFTGLFRQNSLLRLKKDDEAEVILDGIPGVIFQGRVMQVLPAISEGQLQPTANLISFSSVGPPGRVAVAIEITDPRFDEYKTRLPGGVLGQAAIYTEHFHHVGVMRRILLRMASWMNYVLPLH